MGWCQNMKYVTSIVCFLYFNAPIQSRCKHSGQTGCTRFYKVIDDDFGLIINHSVNRDLSAGARFPPQKSSFKASRMYRYKMDPPSTDKTLIARVRGHSSESGRQNRVEIHSSFISFPFTWVLGVHVRRSGRDDLKLLYNKDSLTSIKEVRQSCAGALIEPRVQDT